MITCINEKLNSTKGVQWKAREIYHKKEKGRKKPKANGSEKHKYLKLKG